MAISSLFLNSPFTSVTFPLPSNSVHLSRGSFEAFAAKPRPILNMFPSYPSSTAVGFTGKSSGLSFGCGGWRSSRRSLRQNWPSFLDEEVNKRADGYEHVGLLVPLEWTRFAGCLKNGCNDGLRGASSLRSQGVEDWQLRNLVAPCASGIHDWRALLLLLLQYRDGVVALGPTKHSASDWVLRNRRSEAEGADGRRGGGDTISPLFTSSSIPLA